MFGINEIMGEPKIEDIVENMRQELQVDIHDEILKMYAKNVVFNTKIKTDKLCLIKCFEACQIDKINISEIIGSKENAKTLLEEYKHIQNLIEKEYFSRY